MEQILAILRLGLPGRLQASCRTPGMARKSFPLQRWEKVSWPSGGLDLLDGCRQAAGHPRRLKNVLCIIWGKDFLAIRKLWASWNAAGELPDIQNDREICFSITWGRDFLPTFRPWTSWQAAGGLPDTHTQARPGLVLDLTSMPLPVPGELQSCPPTAINTGRSSQN